MAKRIIYSPDRGELFTEAADHLIDTINSFQQPNVVLALCGGRSIVGLLKKLNEKQKLLSADTWKRLQFFMLDERLVPLDHPDSNYRLVHELFLKDALEVGLISQAQLHPFILKNDVADFGVGDYEATLKQFGGRFDIAFLGVGEDGHIGALFPGHDSIKNNSPLYITMNDSPKPPPLRMTASRALIKTSQLAVALFLGEDKRNAYNAYQNAALPIEKCPVKLVDLVLETLLITDLI